MKEFDFLTEGSSETRIVSTGRIHLKCVSKLCKQMNHIDNNKFDEVMLKEKVVKSMMVAKALWRSEDECCN